MPKRPYKGPYKNIWIKYKVRERFLLAPMDILANTFGTFFLSHIVTGSIITLKIKTLSAPISHILSVHLDVSVNTIQKRAYSFSLSVHNQTRNSMNDKLRTASSEMKLRMSHTLYLHLIVKVTSASVLSTSALCGNYPQILVHLFIKGREAFAKFVLCSPMFKNSTVLG